MRKTLFIKINDRNTLFTHYNIHDKVCFRFNNTDSHHIHISRLAANFIFQAFERRKKHTVEPRLTTTSLLRPLFFVPAKRPYISS